jgi:hypothetical protein
VDDDYGCQLSNSFHLWTRQPTHELGAVADHQLERGLHLGAVHTAAAPRVLSLRSLTTEQSGGADRIRDRRVVFNPVQLAYDSAAHQPNAL